MSESQDQFFTVSEQNARNMLLLSEKQSVIAERRICEIREMACSFSDTVRSLCNDGMSLCETFALLYSDLDLNSCKSHSVALEENKAFLDKISSAFSVIDKALFSDFLCKYLSEDSMRIRESDLLTEIDLPERFVYVKNPLADEAYDVFSQDFEDPRVRYASGFKEAIKMLADGEASYCLLPFEERAGVRISSVAQLIFSEDLKINSVTPVFGIDGTADMKYALVSKSFTVPDRRPEDDRYLEIRLGAQNGRDLSELLQVADFYHHSLYRINTVNFTTEGEEECFVSIVLRDEGHDFLPLLVYLALFSADYTPVGIYKNLE